MNLTPLATIVQIADSFGVTHAKVSKCVFATLLAKNQRIC